MPEIETNYIILDLEWTGHPDGRSHQDIEIPFEIIEIGAVKLDSSLAVIDEFSEFIRPQIFRDLHFKIQEMLHLSVRDLDHADVFPSVIRRFLAWCGKGYRFCTWGPMDLTELQRNLSYYQMNQYFTKPVLYYDLQYIFSLMQGERSPRTLEYAVNSLEIPRQAPFHRALEDARYTAAVLQKMDMDLVHKNYSIDYYRHPLTKSEEIYLSYENYSQFISKEYHKKEDAFRSRSVSGLFCPVCGAKTNRMIRWFSTNLKNYYSLASCRKHGLVQGKIHLKRTPEHNFFVVKTSCLVSDEEAAALTDRYQMLLQKRKEKKQSSAAEKKSKKRL